MMRMLEALMRRAHVGELRQERHIVRRHAVAELPLAPFWNSSPRRKPAATRSSMSTTSSPSRRPFGKPALSPPMTPSGFSVSDGGMATLSRSISLGVTSGG